MKFDKQYYSSINYTNYTNREEKYFKLASELEALLLQLSLINPHTTILDFGCAFGFLVKGFTALGYNNIYGYDISSYATVEALRRGCKILDDPVGDFDIMVALDVLEHMTDREITKMFHDISSNILIGRIPVSKEGDGKFHLEVSCKDATHINCKTKEEWKDLLHEQGFVTILHLNLYSIYDSDGVFSFIAFR
jgi:SAM-dependent methyltransferase